MPRLVLTRRLYEKIWIGENVSVTVTEIERGKVRLCIEAPAEVLIYRQELLAADDVRRAGDAAEARTP